MSDGPEDQLDEWIELVGENIPRSGIARWNKLVFGGNSIRLHVVRPFARSVRPQYSLFFAARKSSCSLAKSKLYCGVSVWGTRTDGSIYCAFSAPRGGTKAVAVSSPFSSTSRSSTSIFPLSLCALKRVGQMMPSKSR